MGSVLQSSSTQKAIVGRAPELRDTSTDHIDAYGYSASRGFTLVELMIGLVLVAVLMGIGLPTFRSFILNQQLRATTSDLRIALTLARSEAIKRNRVVQLRPFDDDEGWGSGWVIPSPIADDPDLLVHRQNGDVEIAKDQDPDDVTPIDFSPMGRVATAVEFEVDIGPSESSIQGCMELGLDGRVTSTVGACGGG